MLGTKSSFAASVAKVGKYLAIGSIIVALTPRLASALVLICTAGDCEYGPGLCADYLPLEPGYACHQSALVNPVLVRTGLGATLLSHNEQHPLLSDAVVDLAIKHEEDRGRHGGIDRANATYMKAFDAAFRSDDRRVSDRLLDRMSKELNVPVTKRELPELSFSFAKIELQYADGRVAASATTDRNGQFIIRTIPPGAYFVKVSRKNPALPQAGMLYINGISHIVCCCPGPPCEKPFELEVGDKPSGKAGVLFLKTASQYSGRVKPKV